MRPTAKLRRTELDVAKGLALFLVVIGHVFDSDGVWFNWIFSFHMPAFFFLSGMVFQPTKYKGFKQFLKRKAQSRLLPYFLITLLGFLICMLRPDYRLPILQDGWKMQLFWIFYDAQPRNLYIGQVWFLVCLFVAEVLAYLWLQIFRNRSSWIKCDSLLAIAALSVHIRALSSQIIQGGQVTMETGHGAVRCHLCNSGLLHGEV